VLGKVKPIISPRFDRCEYERFARFERDLARALARREFDRSRDFRERSAAFWRAVPKYLICFGVMRPPLLATVRVRMVSAIFYHPMIELGRSIVTLMMRSVPAPVAPLRIVTVFASVLAHVS